MIRESIDRAKLVEAEQAAASFCMGNAQSKTGGYGALAVLSLQVGLQPLLQKKFAPPEVSRVSLVLACELVKMLTSAGLLAASGEWAEVRKGWSFGSMLAAAGTPAVIYAVQNICIQTAYSKLSMLVFNLLNQSKIIFTAAFLYLLANKRQTPRQVAALVMLTGAAAALTLKPNADGASQKDKEASAVGIGCVLAASGLSGLATSLSQITLQTQGRSSFLFSLELAIVSTATLLGGAAASGSLAQFSLRGWRPSTLIPILTQGFGGLLIGQVTKQLGAVEKCFATVLGILITGAAQEFVLPELRGSHANTSNFLVNSDSANDLARLSSNSLKALEIKKRREQQQKMRQRYAAMLVMASILLHASGAAPAAPKLPLKVA